jgi:hypothetical protein
MKSIFSRFAASGDFLAVVALAFMAFAILSTHAHAEEAPQPTKIDVGASNNLKMDRAQVSPLYVEFIGSQVLTERLATFAAAQGFELTSDPTAARAKLVVGGEMAFEGGPKFQKRTRIPLSQFAQDKVPSSSDGQKVTGREVAGIAYDAAIAGIAYKLSLGNFLQGVGLSQLVASIGVATGVTGRLNTWLVGDPRGICLSSCENWKKVYQSIVVNVALEREGNSSSMMVQARVNSETLMPVELLETAMAEVIKNLTQEDTPVIGPASI